MRLEDVPLVVATASGKGGVGKTTVATDLARTYSEMGMTAGLIDADISTPNSVEVVGGEGVDVSSQRLSNEDSMVPPEVNGVHIITKGLVLPDDVPVMGGAQFRAETVMDYIKHVEWPDDTDVVVIDTPPGTGEEIQTIAAAAPPDHAFVVTTPHPSSIRDATKTHEFFKEADIKHSAVVNMAYIPGESVVEHVTDEWDYSDISGVGDATAETVVESLKEQASDYDLFGYDSETGITLDMEQSGTVPYSPEFSERLDSIERIINDIRYEEEAET